jgi:hypothetical protein
MYISIGLVASRRRNRAAQAAWVTAQKDAAKLLTAIWLLNYYLHIPAASVGNNRRTAWPH